VSGGLQRQIEVLERTPSVLRALLSGLDGTWSHRRYGEGTFCPMDVLGHLIQGEIEDWIPRARLILEHGTARPFEAFDHRASGDASMGATVSERLAAFERLREANLDALRALDLDDGDLSLRGTHPDLGEVTLGQLVATWATHDLHHIAQICKAMSYQNRERVGPWRAYLGIIPQDPP